MPRATHYTDLGRDTAWSTMTRATMPISFYADFASTDDDPQPKSNAKRSKRSHESQASTSSAEPPPNERGQGQLIREQAERQHRFALFQKAQALRHDKLPIDMNLKTGEWEPVGPGLGVLCLKNCTSIETFETLGERSSMQRMPPPNSNALTLINISLQEISILANIILVLIEGTHTKQSDENMLSRYSMLVRLFGKECHKALMNHCNFNRTFATLACTVHPNNHDLLNKIIGIAPPKTIRKGSRTAHYFGVFGEVWRCIGKGYKCPPQFELLDTTLVLGQRGGGNLTLLRTIIGNAWNKRRKEAGACVESVTQVTDLDITKCGIDVLGIPSSEINFHRCFDDLHKGAAIAIPVHDLGFPNDKTSTGLPLYVFWTPLLHGKTPFGDPEMTTKQARLLLPPMMCVSNPKSVIGGKHSVRLKMPETFDFMMHRSVAAYNAHLRDCYESRFKRFCAEKEKMLLSYWCNRDVFSCSNNLVPGFQMPPPPDRNEYATGRINELSSAEDVIEEEETVRRRMDSAHASAIAEERNRAMVAFFKPGGMRAEFERLYPPEQLNMKPVSDINFGWSDCKYRLRQRVKYNMKKEERKLR